MENPSKRNRLVRKYYQHATGERPWTGSDPVSKYYQQVTAKRPLTEAPIIIKNRKFSSKTTAVKRQRGCIPGNTYLRIPVAALYQTITLAGKPPSVFVYSFVSHKHTRWTHIYDVLQNTARSELSPYSVLLRFTLHPGHGAFFKVKDVPVYAT